MTTISEKYKSKVAQAEVELIDIRNNSNIVDDFDSEDEDRHGYEDRVHRTLIAKARTIGVYPLYITCDDCGHHMQIDSEHSDYINCDGCGESVAHLVCDAIRCRISDCEAA
jgi:ribosomal protein S27E